VRIIKPTTVKNWMREHPEAVAALGAWLNNVKQKQWRTFSDVRSSYPASDMVRLRSGKPVVIFNIAHNRYRLITGIHFNRGKVFVLRFLTHREYERNQWKEEL